MRPVISDPGMEITFMPRWWTLIASTRIFVASFCGHAVGKGPFGDMIALAAHELMENAAKYSLTPDSAVRCTVRLSDEQVRVTVQNMAGPRHIPVLRAEMANVLVGDPLDVYIQKMQRSVTQEGSQLGLARIRFETGGALALTIDEELVTVEATFLVPALKG